MYIYFPGVYFLFRIKPPYFREVKLEEDKATCTVERSNA